MGHGRNTAPPLPLLRLSPERIAREQERAAARESFDRAFRWSRIRMGLECGALALLGYALYGVAFSITDPADAAVVASAAFLVGYGAPFLRWLFWYLRDRE